MRNHAIALGVLVCWACMGWNGLPDAAAGEVVRDNEPRRTGGGNASDGPDCNGSKPSWPAPQSGCQHDCQCEDGLVCEQFDADNFPGVEEPGRGRRRWRKVCTPGCHIDGVFYLPGSRPAYPDNCQSCQPDISTTEWTPVASGVACRTAAGVCDVTDACDGENAACPEDLKRPATDTCRPAGGDCDIAELCDGAADSCPPDNKIAQGVECRAVAGDCDEAEICDGTSNDCPADEKLGAPHACRVAAGPCDVTEYCNGTVDDCPVDDKVTAGLVCRATAGVCDINEVCDGVSNGCPLDAKLPSTHVCRASAGDCDITETCDGSGADCPDDIRQPASHVCREAAGDCDQADHCDGQATDCPADIKLASSHECRAAAGLCDAPESCDGVSDNCPTDGKHPATHACRPPAGDCDMGESCDGTSDDCPADSVLAATHECRSAAGDCDIAENCDGTTPDCPADAKQPTTHECDGAVSECDQPELCDGTTDTCPESQDIYCDGELCENDVECQSGSCNEGVCGTATCTDTSTCSTGICDLAFGICGAGPGGSCTSHEGCANGFCGVNNTCIVPLGAICHRTEDCGSGLICSCDHFSTCIGSNCPEDRCEPSGTCQVPPGGACILDSDCGIQQAIPLNEVHCENGTCDLLGWPIGTVCETNPPSTFPDGPRPAIGDSPNDGFCESGLCFVSTGAPATYSDPPDYLCCQDVGGACASDSDCCANWGFRRRVCGTGGTCRNVSIEGEACDSDLDCSVTVQDLTCSDAGICHVEPPVPGPIANGQACSADTDCQSLHCGETAGQGLLCIPANTPGNDGAAFGETCDGDGFYLAGDPNGRQCTDFGGDMVCCAGGQLAQTGSTGRCRQCCRNFDTEDDPIGCDLPPTPGAIEETRCVGPNGPTTLSCNTSSDCPDNHQCAVIVVERCCGGRCTNIMSDPENCGACGSDCPTLDDASVCTTFEGCGTGTTPGVCEFSIPCEAEPGFLAGCYDSREDTCGVSEDSCSGIWPMDPAYAACVAELSDCWGNTPAEAVCYTYELDSNTLCDNCDSDSDCFPGEVCRSRCDGNAYNSLMPCAYGSYCAENANDCQD